MKAKVTLSKWLKLTFVTVIARLVLGALLFSIGMSLAPNAGAGSIGISETIACGAILLLIAVRVWFAVRLRGVEIKKRYVQLDYLPMVAYQIGLLLPLVWAFSSLIDFANYNENTGMLLVGSAFYVIALWIIYRSHYDLGTGLSNTLDIKENHELIKTGIYSRIRHPMYLGFLMFAMGQALVVANFVAGMSGLIGIIILITFRVGAEERMMIDEFGDEYSAYRERTERIIPGVW